MKIENRSDDTLVLAISSIHGSVYINNYSFTSLKTLTPFAGGNDEIEVPIDFTDTLVIQGVYYPSGHYNPNTSIGDAFKYPMVDTLIPANILQGPIAMAPNRADWTGFKLSTSQTYWVSDAFIECTGSPLFSGTDLCSSNTIYIPGTPSGTACFEKGVNQLGIGYIKTSLLTNTYGKVKWKENFTIDREKLLWTPTTSPNDHDPITGLPKYIALNLQD